MNPPETVDCPDEASVERFKAEPSSSGRDRLEVFVMSEAGKPIYTFSKREDAITLMPLCSALMNYAQKVQKETLRTMRTSDNLLINLTSRPPLIIIVIHEANSCVDPLILVEQIEAQMISILTAKTLRSVFAERPTFDLKRLLYGSEKLIDSIANLSASVAKLEWPWVQAYLAVTSSAISQTSPNNPILPTPSPSLPARPHRVLVPVVPMPQSTRDSIHHMISSCVSACSKNMVFTLVFRVIKNDSDYDSHEEVVQQDDSQGVIPENSDEQEESGNKNVDFKLVTVCNHHSKHKLKIADIHIVYALLNGSKSQLSSVTSLWMPVCLPRFNQDAFLHSYISYLNDVRNCLVMFSVDREEFENCQKARSMIEDKLAAMIDDQNMKDKVYYQMTPLVHPVLLELQDKLIAKSITESEQTEAQQQASIYNSKLELYHARQLQFLWYQTSKQVLWWQRSSSKPMNPVLYYVTKKMLQSSLKTLWLKLSDDSVFLGWHVPTFQLYAQFDSTITTNEAMEVVQRVTSWIKKEEDNFSIKDYR